MGEFAKALNEGLEAAIQVEVARKEIDDVFDELNTDVLAATDGKVSIIRSDELYRGSSKGIVAFNKSVGANSNVAIAGWRTRDGGYPFTVIGRSEEYDCADRNGLESCLRELVSQPGIGMKLLALTKLQPNKK